MPNIASQKDVKKDFILFLTQLLKRLPPNEKDIINYLITRFKKDNYAIFASTETEKKQLISLIGFIAVLCPHTDNADNNKHLTALIHKLRLQAVLEKYLTIKTDQSINTKRTSI